MKQYLPVSRLSTPHLPPGCWCECKGESYPYGRYLFSPYINSNGGGLGSEWVDQRPGLRKLTQYVNFFRGDVDILVLGELVGVTSCCP